MTFVKKTSINVINSTNVITKNRIKGFYFDFGTLSYLHFIRITNLFGKGPIDNPYR